jgi:NADPH-dependent 2,4-dienoyl-CoA reductase/sulfur reductase-like enzyme
MGRPHIADPEIVNKSLHGQLDEIRPCIRCQVCGEKPSNFFPVRCTVNPVTGREVEYRYLSPAAKKKKVIIVGGGPAGMEAAIIASARGHQVILYEKEKELGGSLRYAAGPDFKSDMRRYLEWLIRKINQSGTDIRLSSEATAESIKKDKPDALIIAVGSEPVIPNIPGIEGKNVVWAGEVDINKVTTGDRVLVAGAGMTGCETALHLVQQGKKVTIVDMLSPDEIARDASLTGRLKLQELLDQTGVIIKAETKLIEITDNAAIVLDNKGERFALPVDTIVLSLGMKSLNSLVKSFLGLVDEEYVIGDCLSPGNLLPAIHGGFNIAAEI